MKELEKMKELKKINILWVIKTDYIKVFYFFIKTLQFSFNFENWPFKGNVNIDFHKIFDF